MSQAEKTEDTGTDWRSLAGIVSFSVMVGGALATSVVFVVKGDAAAELNGATTQAIVQRIEADVNKVRLDVSALNRLSEAFKANAEQTRKNSVRIERNRREFSEEGKEIRAELTSLVAGMESSLRRDLVGVQAAVRSLSERAANRYTSKDAAEDWARLKRWQDDLEVRFRSLTQPRRR